MTTAVSQQPQTHSVSPADSAAPARRYLPLGIDLQGKTCLVVGGGRVGARKAATLLEYGARVVVVAPEVCERMTELIARGGAAWRPETYDPRHLPGSDLVIAATSSPELNAQIAVDAERLNKLSCVTSSGKLSRVLFPARHEQHDLVVAVHSHGRACRRSQRLRDVLAGFLRRTGGARRHDLGVVGIRRADVPAALFHALGRRSTQPTDEALLLRTCCRWEWYFVSDRPRQTAQQLIDLSAADLDTSDQPSPWRRKYGGQAYRHLLSVLCGLDSPLAGETDIVGQFRAALAQASLAPHGPLTETLSAALTAQKTVRVEAELNSAPNGSWVEAIMQRLTERHPTGRILVVGCGRLGRRLAERLTAADRPAAIFSSRAPAAHDELPPDAMPTARLAAELRPGDAVALCTTLPPAVTQALTAPAADLTVLDVAGDHGSLRHALPPSRYVGPDEIAAPPTADQAVSITRARQLIIMETLRRHRRQHGLFPSPPDLRMVGRGSQMSQVQLRQVRRLLEHLAPDLACTITTLDTPGDRDRRTPLTQVTADDFFTRDLDHALLTHRADLAVHSAKDLPTKLADGLCVAALLPLGVNWDCLAAAHGHKLTELPPGARVGASCERRAAAVKALRPDLQTLPVRGNVPDRLAQMDQGRYDALVLAVAGLVRLGLAERISEIFSPHDCPPPPGQGQLALVTRREDLELRRFLEPLDLSTEEGLPWR